MPESPKFDLVDPETPPRAGTVPKFDLVDPGSTPQFDLVDPLSMDELQAKFSDAKYIPPDEEIDRYLDLKRAKLQADVLRSVSDPAFGTEMGLKILKAGWDVGKEFLSGAGRAFLERDPGVLAQSGAEGIARGARNTALMLTEIASKMPGDPMSEPLSAEEKRAFDRAEFRRRREEEHKSARLAAGEETLLPVHARKVDPAIAESTAMVADPMNLLPAGGGALSKAGPVIRRAAGESIELAGRSAEMLARGATATRKFPGKLATKAAEAIVGQTDEAPALAGTLKRGATVGAAYLAGVNPGTLPYLAGAWAAAPVVESVATRAGPVLKAVGKNIAQPSFSEQLGLLANIARDKNAAEWVRAAARFGRPLDPVISAGGRFVEGTIPGAAIGATVGGITGGEEGLISGAGGGAFFGGMGRMAAGMTPGARRAARDADLHRWRSGLRPEQLALLDYALPGVDAQARVMNTEKFISGLGDVDFKYLTPQQWKAEGLSDARALQTSTGNRPVVKVNLAKVGDGTPVLHESGHVLRALYPEQFREIDRMLFSDFTVPKGKGTDFTTDARQLTEGPGLLSPEQQQKLYDQYFSKLDRAEQDRLRSTMDRSQHLQRLRDEVTAEFLTSLLKDSPSDFLMKLGGPQVLKDRLILSGRRALIGRIPLLNRIGKKVGPSGSTLFTLDGRPLKMDARTAAQLRQVLRMRDRAVERVEIRGGSENDMAGATGVVGPGRDDGQAR
jgi:hypothetical protein